MITHVVLFKLQDLADRDETIRRLRSLDGNVPVLRSLQVGADVLRSERSYDVALIATFDSLDDLATYNTDPFHREVIAYVRGVAERVHSVDFEN